MLYPQLQLLVTVDVTAAMEQERVRRMFEWSRGNPQGPVSVHLDPTNRCNVRCVFCWMRSHERRGLLDTTNELPDARLLSLVDEAAQLGVVDWLISGGGEPMLRPVTLKVMRRIKQRDMAGDIITNGTLFKERDVRDLVKLGWDRIRVSLLAPDAKTHDWLMAKEGSHALAMRSLKWMVHYKAENGAAAPEIGFNTILSSGNYTTLPELVELLAEIGGTNINTQTIILYGKEEEWTSLNEEHRRKFPKYARKAVRIARRHSIRTNLDSYLNKQLVEKSSQLEHIHELMDTPFEGFIGSHCFQPFYLLTIRANGIAGSCRLFGDKGTSLHDKSLAEAWNGPYFTRAREHVLSHKLFDYCKHCNANEYMENVKIRRELVPMAREAGLPVIQM